MLKQTFGYYEINNGGWNKIREMKIFLKITKKNY